MTFSRLSSSGPKAKSSIDEVALKSRIEERLSNDCVKLDPFEQCMYLVVAKRVFLINVVLTGRRKSYGESLTAEA